ncbi:oxygenase MpaB family protein [Gordonia sp. VNK21]|uniref:oxygenase MpaB family protein n=1 Tax=Gordonia sp. VNK21 TaxID=3382483 RepID=UPI0038D36B84
MQDRPALELTRPTLRETDYGFFGPDSPTWKVWTHPTALIGFQRAVTLEHFDPGLTAAVADLGGIYSDPRGRLDHTFAYFLIAAVGDGRTAVSAADHLLRVHAQSTGIEPISGKRYSANNPASQLWIHITGWHSVLKCYEVFGPGPLDPDEEQQFWAECVIAAGLQTCREAEVPTSRAEVREYFAQVRPTLCVSERARRGMHYLLYTPRDRGLTLWAGARAVAPAAVATLPRWMRELGGFDQPRLLEAGYIPAAQALMRLAGARPELLEQLLPRLIGPMTADLYRQHRRGGVPQNPATVSVAQARERYAEQRTPA